jgi:hypothetical protein
MVCLHQTVTYGAVEKKDLYCGLKTSDVFGVCVAVFTTSAGPYQNYLAEFVEWFVNATAIVDRGTFLLSAHRQKHVKKKERKTS